MLALICLWWVGFRLDAPGWWHWCMVMTAIFKFVIFGINLKD